MSEKETEESSMNHCFPERTGAPMAIDTNTHIRSRAKDTHKHTHTQNRGNCYLFLHSDAGEDPPVRSKLNYSHCGVDLCQDVYFCICVQVCTHARTQVS